MADEKNQGPADTPDSLHTLAYTRPCDEEDWIDRIVDAEQRRTVRRHLQEHQRLEAALLSPRADGTFCPFAPKEPFRPRLPELPHLVLDEQYGGPPAACDDNPVRF